MRPLRWGLTAVAVVAVLFEPVRLALWTLGDEVGGVGGVGGLTNQFGCRNASEASADDGAEAPYCFQPGWLGFTVFGGTMLLLWTAPLALAGLAASLATHQHPPHDDPSGGPDPRGSLNLNDDGDGDGASELRVMPGGVKGLGAPNELHVTSFTVLGGVATILWFVVPLAAFASSDFYQTDAWHAILAVSIAAAYPLSWHLSFVAIPSAGAPLLAPLLGLAPAALKACHVRAAKATLFWGCVHASGQLVYLASQGTLDTFRYSPPTSNRTDSLLFIFGLTTLFGLAALSSHALLRRSPSVAPSFRTVHRAAAGALLLVASAHWWPFAIFLAPAVACAATGRALEGFGSGNPDGGAQAISAAARAAPLALIAAVAATLAGVVPVWAARQAWMLAHPADYYTLPVQLFPPAAVGLAFVLARAAAATVLAIAVARARGGGAPATEALLGN